MIIVNGETVDITVKGTNAVTVSGNTVNIEVTGARGATGATGAQGPQGDPGTPAAERKLCIVRIREDHLNINVDIETLLNTTEHVIDVSHSLGSDVIVVQSTLFLNHAYTINCISAGASHRITQDPGTFTLLGITGIGFVGFSDPTEWIYITIESMDQYII